MNWLVVLVFALAAFFFLESDMVFLALLCVVGLVLSLYYYSSAGAGSRHSHGARGAHGGHASHAGGYDGEGPMVIKVGGKHKKPPELYRVRVYPTWENRSMWEEMGKNFLGPIMNVFGSTAYRVASGKHSEKGKDIQPDETFRGR